MSYLPLLLGAGLQSDPEGGERKPPKIDSEKIWRRDSYTCRFCGFHAQKYQRVVMYSPEKGGAEAVTACLYCDQAINLDKVALTGAGFLIWCPELAQPEIHHVVRAAYVARDADDQAYRESGDRIIDALTQRRADVKKRLGTDDPHILATVIAENKDLKKVALSLEGVRYLPAAKYLVRTPRGDVDQFSAIVKYWRTMVDGIKAPEDWQERFRAG